MRIIWGRYGRDEHLMKRECPECPPSLPISKLPLLSVPGLLQRASAFHTCVCFRNKLWAYCSNSTLLNRWGATHEPLGISPVSNRIWPCFYMHNLRINFSRVIVIVIRVWRGLARPRSLGPDTFMSAGAFLRAVNGGDGSYAVLPVPQMGHLHVSHTHTYPFFGFSTLGCWSNAGTEANPLSLSLSLPSQWKIQLTSCISEVWDLYEFLLYYCIDVCWGSQTEQSGPKRPPFAAAHGVKLRQRHAEDFFRLVIVP